MRKDYPNASYKLRHHRRATVVYSNQGLRWREQDDLEGLEGMEGFEGMWGWN